MCVENFQCFVLRRSEQMAQYGSAIWAKRDSSGLQLGDEPPLVIDQNIGVFLGQIGPQELTALTPAHLAKFLFA